MILVLHAEGKPEYRLKQAEAIDCEDLRVWKNANRQYFFFKDEISHEMQAKWFANLQASKTDMMLMVQEYDGEKFVNVGCMGYRLEDDGDEKSIDVYNIMRGRTLEGSTHSMAEAFNMMNAFLHTTAKLPVGCLVLADNPARGWYEQNGFELQGEADGHVVYKLNPAKLKPVKVEVAQL